MAIIDRIKFDGQASGLHWLVYKYPSEQFVLGSQLIVNQGQEALFLKGGEALDLFGPGTHTLTTGNLPLLNKLVNLPFGGKTPFTAEIYYVNRTVKLDLPWGTQTAIPLEDPKYGLLLNVGAYGQYGIAINNTRLFLSRIIGAIPHGAIGDYTTILKYFSGLIAAKTKSVVSEYMIKKQISFLEISAYLSELSDLFREAVRDEFDRFGVEIVNFFCESIAPNQKDYEKLRGYKEELALGKDFYRERRSLDIAEELAKNPSTGGIANAGIGLGMGLGAVNQFGTLFSNIGSTVQAPPANTPACPHCGAGISAGMKFCGACGKPLAATTVCPHCNAEIPAGMKFCGNCGASLSAAKCPSCGTENRPGMKFCGNCGAQL
jgi:membrane protease subunit (stomatin/prohibitin family)